MSVDYSNVWRKNIATPHHQVGMQRFGVNLLVDFLAMPA